MSFYKKYIMLNLNEYKAFEGVDLYITIFLAALAITMCVGIFLASQRKNTMIRVIKQLYRHGATTEEGAKTVSELGMKNTSQLRALLNSGRLSRAIVRVGEKKQSYEEYIASEKAKKQEKRKKRISEKVKEGEKCSFDTYKFYISKESDIYAKGIISKNPTSPLNCTLLCLFVISISACLILLMPKILELLNSLLT